MIEKLRRHFELSKVSLTDIIAGLSIAGLLIPEAVAYSSIANLPPQAGIIALFAGLLCYGLLGKSRFAIVSATSSSAVVLAAATGSLAQGDDLLRQTLAVALVLMVGCFFVIAAIAKLGKVTDFISKPVLRGFTFGLAIVIIVKQFASAVGIKAGHTNLFYNLYTIFHSITAWNLISLMVFAISLVLLFCFSRFRRFPGGLFVIVISILASYFLGLSQEGVHLVGDIDLRLPELSFPEITKTQWLRLGEIALALSLILYSESYGSIRSFSMKHGDAISPNQDLFALGVSNIVSGLFRGMPVAAGYSATAANESVGATSRLSGLVSAMAILIIVLLFLPAIAFTPEPVLAAIVVCAVSHTVTPNLFKPYFSWRRDRLVIVSAIFGVFFLGVIDGLVISIVMSLAMLLKQFADSHITHLGRLGNTHDFVDLSQYADAKMIDGVAIFRADRPLFFANSERTQSQIQDHVLMADDHIHTIILSLEESPDIDSSSIESIKTLFEFVQTRNKALILARLKEPVYKILQQVVPTSSKSILLTDLSVDEAVILAMKLKKQNEA